MVNMICTFGGYDLDKTRYSVRVHTATRGGGGYGYRCVCRGRIVCGVWGVMCVRVATH